MLTARGQRRTTLALAAALGLGTPWPARVEGQGSPRAGRRASVLMVFSGDSNSPAVMGQQRAFERTLVEKLGAPADFQAAYLDLTGEPDAAFEQNLATFLAQKFGVAPIDLVLVQRAEGLALLLRHRAPLLTGVPLVFLEVLSGELDRIDLTADVSGVVTTGFPRTVPIALDLLPETRRFVIVAGGTSFDRRSAASLQQNLNAGWPGLEVERLDGKPLDEQIARLGRLPPHSLILVPSYRGDASGRARMAAGVMEALAAEANGPIFGFEDAFLGSGLTGGDLVQLEVLAERAAVLAARILKGEPASSIPPVREPASVVAFDARQLERWGIPERRLPPGSVVRFRPPTIWSQYRWHVLGALGLLAGQGLLIGFLVLERRSRQQAQDRLADAEHRYRTVADFAADWEFWIDDDGSLLYMSPSCEAVTGYDVAAFMARPELLGEIIVEEDRASWRKHRERTRTEPGAGSLQFRIRTRDGRERWIEHACSRVTGPDGSSHGRRGSNRDVTERREGEEELRRALREIEQLRDRLEMDNTYLRERLQPEDGIEGLLGTSEAMRYVTSRIQQVAPTTTTVLLLGETGVGKSLVAQAIHDRSPRRARPLVTLNCAALPASLVESELFGHEKGAFTGALAQRIGRFEIADGGTLFLDEVAELPLELQGKLLRAVQEGEFERVGSNVTRKTDVRIIAATNRRLDEAVRTGRFRQDLLYRLNVFPITVPPLRQRPDDIPLLVGHFLQKHCRRLGVPVPAVSRATTKALQAREWPGNIRELENVVERVLIASRGARFEIADEPAGPAPARPAEADASGTGRTLAEVERSHVLATLERLQWRIEGPGGAADLLGLNASTLRSRMRKHGIRRPDPHGGGSTARGD